MVTARGDADWAALCAVVPGLDAGWNRTERLAGRKVIEAALTAWLAQHSADTAMRLVQGAGIPAARMLRVSEQPDFAYYRERGIFREETHPHLNETYHTEAMHVRSAAIAPPDGGPAPLMGEHTAEVMRDWLGMTDAEIDTLIDQGVLEPVSAQVIAALAKAKEQQA